MRRNVQTWTENPFVQGTLNLGCMPSMFFAERDSGDDEDSELDVVFLSEFL
jgi:hypothetical protein